MNRTKISRSLIFLFSCLLLLTSCSKDDDPVVPEPPVEEGLELEGDWTFEKLDFLDESIVWDPAIDFSVDAAFGYAPYMFAGTQGFEFGTKKVAGDRGQKFIIINDGDRGDESTDYWYWNYTEDKQSFEIGQINPAMPPYNFSIMDISDIRESENKDKIVFKAGLNSRKVGGGFTDIEKVPVEITMTRGLQADSEVEMSVKGQPFEMPRPQTVADKLLGKSWKLLPGSEVYDPGFEDQDPALEYMKVVALQLTENDTLNYRYSFPMGIVSTKQYVQDALDENILKTLQGGGSFGGGEEQIISWKIESIDTGEGELKLMETESEVVRTFVLIDDIEIDVDKDEYEIITSK